MFDLSCLLLFSIESLALPRKLHTLLDLPLHKQRLTKDDTEGISVCLKRKATSRENAMLLADNIRLSLILVDEEMNIDLDAITYAMHVFILELKLLTFR